MGKGIPDKKGKEEPGQPMLEQLPMRSQDASVEHHVPWEENMMVHMYQALLLGGRQQPHQSFISIISTWLDLMCFRSQEPGYYSHYTCLPILSISLTESIPLQERNLEIIMNFSFSFSFIAHQCLSQVSPICDRYFKIMNVLPSPLLPP